MDLEKYAFWFRDDRYVFISKGPKGKIEKAVRFYKVADEPFFQYSLSFGDWDERWGRINDRIVTNNGDRQKILATVAAIVIDFTVGNSDAGVFATGSTPSRTRLYQMGIGMYYSVIAAVFEIQGLIRGVWEPFQKGRPYIAFFVKRKKSLIL